MLFVSIVIPIYNAQHYLNRCIDSILSQCFENCEIILIGDGSVDQSGSICDFYASQYQNISVLHIKNGGVSNARNIGISLAKGEYIMFVDADDELLPNALNLVYERVKKDEYPDLLIFDNCVKDTNNIIFYPHKQFAIDKCYASNEFLDAYWQARIGTSFPAPWARVYKNEVIKANKLFFDTKLTRNEDEVFNCNFFSFANVISLASDVIYIYYNTPNSAVSIYRGNAISYQINAVADANRKMMLKISNTENANIHWEKNVASLINLHICLLYASDCIDKRRELIKIIKLGKELLGCNFSKCMLSCNNFRARLIGLFYKKTYILHILQLVCQKKNMFRL